MAKVTPPPEQPAEDQPQRSPREAASAADPLDAVTRSGQLQGKYHLLKRIGSGGMGVVYLADDPFMNRLVAIKFLLREAARNPAIAKRFLTEAQVTGRLNHPNIIAIYDVLIENGSVSIVMELLKPASAFEHVQQHGPLHWLEATRIIADCCSALSATHQAGLIHRDIKPGNILCSPAGVTKLVDFGMVKEIPLPNTEPESSFKLAGTAIYMSPEQIAGKLVDQRSDIYSLGITYYELLTGRPPFTDKPPQIYFQHYFEPPPDPRTFVADISEECVKIIMRALAKEPAGRYQTAEEMRNDLTHLLKERSADEHSFKFLCPSPVTLQSFQVTAAPEPAPSPSVLLEPALVPASAAEDPPAKLEAAPPARRRSWLQFVVVFLMLAVAAGAVAVLRGILRGHG